MNLAIEGYLGGIYEVALCRDFPCSILRRYPSGMGECDHTLVSDNVNIGFDDALYFLHCYKKTYCDYSRFVLLEHYDWTHPGTLECERLIG
jgi:hypothetical protein